MTQHKKELLKTLSNEQLVYLIEQMLYTELLTDLREKKEQLTQELIEHGCRRKN